MEYFEINKNNKNKKKHIYYGIEVLRMILSFLIIVIHCHNKNFSSIKLLLFSYHLLDFYVPTFFIISFYFSFKIFESKNINKIKQRFKRLLIPYIIWPIIFWIKYNIFNILKRNKKDLFKYLYYQLLIGCGVYGIFWFLFNIIFHSMLFSIIILLFNKNYSNIMQLIFILITIYNYSGYNKYFFEKFNLFVIHSIRPILITFFYSITGFFLGSINILDKLYKYKRIIMIELSLIAYSIIKNKNILIKTFPNYHVFIINFISTIFFIIFAYLPFEKIKNNFIISFIKQITKYTGGVYYLHPEVRHLFPKYLKIKIRSSKECIIIYLLCYIFCLIGSSLFKKYNLKYLFI